MTMSTSDPVEEHSRRGARRRLVTLGTIGVGGAIVAGAVVAPEYGALTDLLADTGGAAPAAFVLGYAALSLLLVPGAFLSMAAGALFGPLWGSVLAFAGGVLGSTAAFLVGRRLGRAPMQVMSGPRMDKVDGWLRDHGILTLAVVRILPAMPYSLLNYAAGMTGIPFGHYVKGSLLGLIPGAVAYATLGGTLSDPLSWQFAAALALIAAVLVTGRVAERRLSRRR